MAPKTVARSAGCLPSGGFAKQHPAAWLGTLGETGKVTKWAAGACLELGLTPALIVIGGIVWSPRRRPSAGETRERP